jgi:hypothetical protein
MICVKVFPHTYSAHTDEILTGLWELNHAEALLMKYVFNDPLGVDVVDSTLYRHILSALVIDTSKNIERRICFDLNDGPEIALDHLKACHYYFKRTFNSKSLNSLDRLLRPRLLPYGVSIRGLYFHELLDTDRQCVVLVGVGTCCGIRSRSTYHGPLSGVKGLNGCSDTLET